MMKDDSPSVVNTFEVGAGGVDCCTGRSLLACTQPCFLNNAKASCSMVDSEYGNRTTRLKAVNQRKQCGCGT